MAGGHCEQTGRAVSREDGPPRLTITRKEAEKSVSKYLVEADLCIIAASRKGDGCTRGGT